MEEIRWYSLWCLGKGVKEYYKEFDDFDEKYPHDWTFQRPKLTDTGYQIQKTTPESGGYIPHHDSRSEYMDNLPQTRILTFIWYLNTWWWTNWDDYREDIQPEEGKLVLFPEHGPWFTGVFHQGQEANTLLQVEHGYWQHGRRPVRCHVAFLWPLPTS